MPAGLFMAGGEFLHVHKPSLDVQALRRSRDGVPTVEHLQKIGMDLPEVIALVKKHL
jgi:hypothetical protein